MRTYRFPLDRLDGGSHRELQLGISYALLSKGACQFERYAGGRHPGALPGCTYNNNSRTCICEDRWAVVDSQ